VKVFAEGVKKALISAHKNGKYEVAELTKKNQQSFDEFKKYCSFYFLQCVFLSVFYYHYFLLVKINVYNFPSNSNTSLKSNYSKRLSSAVCRGGKEVN
jgi:hypothetical protein